MEIINCIEQYSWVDARLSEMYNRYALTSENIDDYMEAGLLNERWAWADSLLETKAQETPSTLRKRKFSEIEESEDEDDSSIDEEPASILGKRKYSEMEKNIDEEPASILGKRKYSEMASLPTQVNTNYVIHISNPFCNLDVERYNFNISAAMDEVHIVSDSEDAEDEEEEAYCDYIEALIQKMKELRFSNK